MSTHKHEWTIDWEEGRAFCRYPCGKEMYYWEIERRLNATECLSAEDASHIADCIATDSAIAFPYADDLGDYARALEDQKDKP